LTGTHAGDGLTGPPDKDGPGWACSASTIPPPGVSARSRVAAGQGHPAFSALSQARGGGVDSSRGRLTPFSDTSTEEGEKDPTWPTHASVTLRCSSWPAVSRKWHSYRITRRLAPEDPLLKKSCQSARFDSRYRKPAMDAFAEVGRRISRRVTQAPHRGGSVSRRLPVSTDHRKNPRRIRMPVWSRGMRCSRG